MIADVRPETACYLQTASGVSLHHCLETACAVMRNEPTAHTQRLMNQLHTQRLMNQLHTQRLVDYGSACRQSPGNGGQTGVQTAVHAMHLLLAWGALRCALELNIVQIRLAPHALGCTPAAEVAMWAAMSGYEWL